MKKLKKLTLTQLVNAETANQVLSAQNLKELKGGAWYDNFGTPSSGGVGVSYRF